MGGVEGDEADVVRGIGLAAAVQLQHDAGRVAQVEHGIAEHFPVDVARMRVVGVFDADRPALGQAVVDLLDDLLVAEVGQEGEGALCDAHDVLVE
jgi:hypothetical protein